MFKKIVDFLTGRAADEREEKKVQAFIDYTEMKTIRAKERAEKPAKPSLNRHSPPVHPHTQSQPVDNTLPNLVALMAVAAVLNDNSSNPPAENRNDCRADEPSAPDVSSNYGGGGGGNDSGGSSGGGEISSDPALDFPRNAFKI